MRLAKVHGKRPGFTVYLHPGINTIAWCPSTLFTHRGHKRFPQAALRIASTDSHLSITVWEYSPRMRILPLGDKHIHPHALEEGEELPNIPIMVIILPPVPSLSNLCRLTMGIMGVTKGGIVDLPLTASTSKTGECTRQS